ncbi:hypothetical protein MMAD_35750 [Mycolicibacterium madagascariense]|uniref:Uncharacterized protein n=1 Tax=Mycolicibacterium madagascariense TaxID=212765 RepID=A0A7I7XJB3_9MYCO|nr:hypothetical protein [Mycolicibacterium madagascariense]MCV7013814.1 hypothetical protein [Mycolicibacterium madagascariense]BBZ29280.1 hypothetical protein MMAD_35750 [Mycolicibacterium madagascariense]
MLTALRSAIAAVGLCLGSVGAVAAASWIGGLDGPHPTRVPPAPPAGDVYRHGHCLSCPDDGLAPMKPLRNP